MSDDTKPGPRVGMVVEWIDPAECDVDRAHWIRRRLIGKHGPGPFEVHAVSGTGPWTVTLLAIDEDPKKEKVLLCQRWTGEGESPVTFRGTPIQFDWDYLRTVEDLEPF
jgi:hypothetical protein